MKWSKESADNRIFVLKITRSSTVQSNNSTVIIFLLIIPFFLKKKVENKRNKTLHFQHIHFFSVLFTRILIHNAHLYSHQGIKFNFCVCNCEFCYKICFSSLHCFKLKIVLNEAIINSQNNEYT